jgi:hypothetical protein
MTSADELDQLWRDGLAVLAEQLAPPTDPETRVALRRRRRRRGRNATKLAAVVASIAVVAITIAVLARGSDQRTRVTSPPPPVPVATVAVVDTPRGSLRIDFPGRRTGSLPLQLPSGLIRFQVVSGSPGHQLVLDGPTGFRVQLSSLAMRSTTTDVQLAPGQYAMHCIIPSHTEAGEQAVIVVSAQPPETTTTASVATTRTAP